MAIKSLHVLREIAQKRGVSMDQLSGAHIIEAVAAENEQSEAFRRSQAENQ
jgi:hypothetical protein